VRPGQSARGPSDLFIAKDGRPADTKNRGKKKVLSKGEIAADKTVFTGATHYDKLNL